MIYVVLGTKAQLIKMAPILKLLQENNIDYKYIHTGQHIDYIKEISDNFQIKYPDFYLHSGKDIDTSTGMLIWLLRVIFKISSTRKNVLQYKQSKNILLVHGDTISTLLGAIIGKFCKIEIGHIESGLRSFNIFHPFPEEITRLFVFSLSKVFYCQDNKAIQNLKKYNGRKINTEGNSLADSVKFFLREKKINDGSEKNLYAIATIHRYENISTRTNLKRIVDIIIEISTRIKVKFILHKPTFKMLKKYKLLDKLDSHNVELSERLDYKNFVILMENSEFLVSDGGSNQEECSYIGKPILLLRKTTERSEGLGKNCVVSNYDIKTINKFLNNYNNLKIKNMPLGSPSKVIFDDIVKYNIL